MNQHTPYQKPSWIKKYYAENLVGLSKVLYILSCFQTTKRSTQMFTFNKRPEKANRKEKVRPRTSLAACKKLLKLCWEVVSHAPYSPRLAPSDYHLFQCLQNFLNLKKKISYNDDLKTRLVEFFCYQKCYGRRRS